jgi:hypothetical protein
MKILNRLTLQVGNYHRSLPLVTISKNSKNTKMVFMKPALDRASLKAGSLIEFILDQGKLYVKKTLDPAGFNLLVNGHQSYISCSELFEVLKERIDTKKQIQSITYRISETTREPIAGFVLYELTQISYQEFKQEASK